MPSSTDFTTAGKVLTVQDGQIVFAPRGTRYQLHLKTAGQYTGPTNTLVEVLIKVQARKLWTVPSGGNFITPIVGPPKTIQGWVRYMVERQIVVSAGAKFIVELTATDSSYDLNNGQIALNTMINVVALPGARMELAAATAGAGAGH